MTTRRDLLRTIGVASVGGVAGLAGCSSEGKEMTTTADATTTRTTANATTTASQTTTTGGGSTSERFVLGNTTVLDDFEDLSPWTADNGALEADTSRTFAGSQSMHITAPASDGFAWVSRDADWDLSGKTLSLAVDLDAPVDNVIVVVRLIAPDTQNVLKMGELVRLRKNQGWIRLDLDTRSFKGDPDLSSVSQVQIGMRAADGAIDFRVDDLRAVPRPEKGYVVLSFDDSLESHYTEAFKTLKQYDMPGNVGVITGQIGTDGSLTVDQMKEMKGAGWEFASHSTKDAALTSMSTQEMWLAINDANDWLANKGFTDGNDAFVYPHGEYNDDIIKFVERSHSMGYRYMDPLSASSGLLTDPMTIGRGNAAYNMKLNKTMVNYAELFHNLTVFTFHGIDSNGGLSIAPKDFEEFVNYVDRRDVEVVTFSQVKEQLLAN